ncbi:unnamed protein product [Rotaria sp. Silwood1]|nr:unnamed protein product [Rotaria sp. Silwood1]CAF3877075.1 unnamed protein product [Rotaria sp. Silwood1]
MGAANGQIKVIGADPSLQGLNHRVKDNEKIKVIGNIEVTCILTPCHTVGHVCYLVTVGGPRMISTNRLKALEFDPILIDYKVQLSLDMAYCALRQRNFKLSLTKLNDTRNRLDLC